MSVYMAAALKIVNRNNVCRAIICAYLLSIGPQTKYGQVVHLIIECDKISSLLYTDRSTSIGGYQFNPEGTHMAAILSLQLSKIAQIGLSNHKDFSIFQFHYFHH